MGWGRRAFVKCYQYVCLSYKIQAWKRQPIIATSFRRVIVQKIIRYNCPIYNTLLWLTKNVLHLEEQPHSGALLFSSSFLLLICEPPLPIKLLRYKLSPNLILYCFMPTDLEFTYYLLREEWLFLIKVRKSHHLILPSDEEGKTEIWDILRNSRFVPKMKFQSFQYIHPNIHEVMVTCLNFIWVFLVVEMFILLADVQLLFLPGGT